MFNLDPGKLLVIGVVAIVLLGPDRLPQVARQAGGAWKSFNEFRQRMEAEVRSNIPDLPSSVDLARMTSSPTALFDHLEKMGSPAPASSLDHSVVTGIAETRPTSANAVAAWVTESSDIEPVSSPTWPHLAESITVGDANLN
jgi:sec-independent protein translocase protein TatB